MMKKRLIQVLFLALLALTLIGCGGEPRNTVVLSELGILNEDNTLTPGYKFAPMDRDLVFTVDVYNEKKRDIAVDAVWQYRQGPGFGPIVKTTRDAIPGESQIAFPFQSNIDLLPGEYLVEAYMEGNLIAAHRFWVLTEGKETNDSIGLYELSRCSVHFTDFLCAQDELCEAVFFEAEGVEEQQFTCEAL